MHFGENQLSRSLIGLSPLHTGHPPGFQPWWVRSSTQSYPRFNLPMRRSPRFGSTACDSGRPIQTRFRYGSPTRVNLATHHNSQAHSSKGTQSHHKQASLFTLLRLVGTRFQVLFHDPSPGRFSPFPHGTRSLSVIRKYLGLPGGPGRFTQDSSSPVLLGNTPNSRQNFAYPAITVYGRPSQSVRLPHRFLTVRGDSGLPRKVPQPRTRNARRLSHAHGLASSAFAHHYSRNHYLFSSPTGTEMFHFPALPPTALYIQAEATPHDWC